MNEGRTVFAQLMDALPKYEFDKCVQRYRGNFRVRSLPAYEQFLVMAFAQLTFRDPASGQALVFLSNNFTQPALTIAQLYHCRWQIELFFKWIKQHLRIKAFYGTSENAVRTQVWIAIAVYLLVALLKKRLHLSSSLYTILQILSLTLFEKTPILQALSSQPMPAELLDTQNQPCLPGFLTGQ